MWLQNNPFYILSVTCRDSRRAIASAADKLSFIYDASACDEAQNLLLIPSRRLSAELDWFIDLSREEIEEIRICIKNQDPIPTDTLTSLSALNATLYNFAIAEKTDYLEIGYALFDIDEQYTDLNIREITRMINDCHSSAKMADVQEQDVSLELGKKREDIRQIINEKLSVLNDETYTELITMLAEKYIASEDDGVILSDIVDQYEIRMQSVIEESTEHIKSHIDRIKHLANDDVVEDSLKELIGRVQNWDKLVQPLQLKSMATGMPHAISEDLGRELRKLALYLHNEQGKTEESLALVEAMQDIFAELGNLTEIFNDDSDVLKDLIQGDKDFEEVLAELDSLEKSADSVKEYPSKPNIDSLITRVKALDIKIKSLEIDDELKIKIRGNVCYMARIVAINLHNDKQQTTHALSIAQALLDEFGDMPELRGMLTEDVVTLYQQMSIQAKNMLQRKPAEKSENIGCLVNIGIVVVIFIVLAIVETFSSGSSSPTTSFPSHTQTQHENELDELEKELDFMELRLNERESNIYLMESQLQSLSDDIDYYEQQYDRTGSSTYYNSYYDAIDEYNSIYDDYSTAIDDYNNLYDEYSSAVDDYNAKAH